MVEGALAKIIAKVLVDLLQYVQAREDLKTAVRAEMEVMGLNNANEALGWKAAAVGSSDGGATLGVLPGAVQITISGDRADIGGVTLTPGLQPGAEPKDVPPPPAG